MEISTFQKALKQASEGKDVGSSIQGKAQGGAQVIQHVHPTICSSSIERDEFGLAQERETKPEKEKRDLAKLSGRSATSLVETKKKKKSLTLCRLNLHGTQVNWLLRGEIKLIGG